MARGRVAPGAAGAEPMVVVVERRGRFEVGEPVFERGGRVPLASGPRPEVGTLALVEPGRKGARVVRTLGDPDNARDVVDALLAHRGLRHGFSDTVEAEAAATAGATAQDRDRRRDLTDLPTFTVDPATARDFDDAVSARVEEDGVRLWIHIADVAAHVRPGTALDAEAYARANSTYVPGAVEPMLPPALSADACSLAPGVDRLAVTAEIDVSRAGEPRSASYSRTVIRSDIRLDYDQLDEVFASRARPPAEVAEQLGAARDVVGALARRRPASALSVSGTEPEFVFENGAVVGSREVAHTEAHQLIEQLMILCNEQVATLLERCKAAALYRVHEQPDPQRVALLVEQLAALGVPTPPVPDLIGPTEAGALAGEASRLATAEAARRGHGRAAYTTLVLRAMKQALYSDRNLGHAGLGSPAYAHFTSPIRRYPDLIAHRALLAALGGGEDPPDPAEVRRAGPHCSERERDAVGVERDADSICAAFLLRRELFEAGWEREFDGEVSGLVGAGAFVRFGGELGECYEGFLPARLLRGERFEINETETALVGRRSGRAVRLGDPVTVGVDSVDAPGARVDLVPVRAGR